MLENEQIPQMSDKRLLELAELEDGCCVSVGLPDPFPSEGEILRGLLRHESKHVKKMQAALEAFADTDNWFDCYAGAYAQNFTPYPGWRGPMENDPEKFAQQALEYDEEPTHPVSP